jgi:hypothetical protein
MLIVIHPQTTFFETCVSVSQMHAALQTLTEIFRFALKMIPIYFRVSDVFGTNYAPFRSKSLNHIMMPRHCWGRG